MCLDILRQGSRARPWIAEVTATSPPRGSSPALTARRTRLLVVTAIMLGLLFFTACGFQLRASTPTGLATVSPSPSPTPIPPPALSVVFCPDSSSSYPAQLREQAKQDFISQLDRLIAPGSPGVQVWEYWIALHTRLHKIDAFVVPGVRGAPVREPDPPQPQPPDPNDPAFIFDRGALKRAQEDYQHALGDWHRTVAEHEQAFKDAQVEVIGALAGAHDAVAQAGQTLKTAQPPVWDDGSDFGGCFEKAAAVLARASGPRFLVIASDMQAWGEQDLGNLSLNGVQVRVIDFWCLRVSECDAARAKWEPLLSAAGASSIDFYDPDVALDPIWK